MRKEGLVMYLNRSPSVGYQWQDLQDLPLSAPEPQFWYQGQEKIEALP